MLDVYYCTCIFHHQPLFSTEYIIYLETSNTWATNQAEISQKISNTEADRKKVCVPDVSILCNTIFLSVTYIQTRVMTETLFIEIHKMVNEEGTVQVKFNEVSVLCVSAL